MDIWNQTRYMANIYKKQVPGAQAVRFSIAKNNAKQRALNKLTTKKVDGEV